MRSRPRDIPRGRFVFRRALNSGGGFAAPEFEFLANGVSFRFRDLVAGNSPYGQGGRDDRNAHVESPQQQERLGRLGVAQRNIEAGSVQQIARKSKGQGHAEFYHPPINGAKHAFPAMPVFQFVQIADIRHHGADQREESAQPKGDQGGGDQQHEGLGRVVAEPFQRISDDGDRRGNEKGLPFADLRGQPGDQGDNAERANRGDRAEPTHQRGAQVLVAAVEIVNDDVGPETGDHHEAVEDEEGGGAQFEEGTESDRDQEAFEELGDVGKKSSEDLALFFSLYNGLVTFLEEDGGQGAYDDDDGADGNSQALGSLHGVVEQPVVFHNGVKPGHGHPGELADEVAEAHQAGAFMIIRSQFVTERDEGSGEDGVCDVEDVGADQKNPEVEAFAMTGWNLPHQGKDQSGQDGAGEDVGPASSPTRAGMIGDIAHDGIRQSVGKPGEGHDGPDQGRIHSQTEIEHDRHAAQ